jgi:hypothetical protein
MAGRLPRPYSDFQATEKLVPSEERVDVVSSAAPLLLTMLICCTLVVGNAPIGPDFDPSVA